MTGGCSLVDEVDGQIFNTHCADLSAFEEEPI